MEIETIVVARGRTVIHDDGEYGPGQSVKIPAADAARLRRLGFVADPNAPVMQPAPGIVGDVGLSKIQGPDFSAGR